MFQRLFPGVPNRSRRAVANRDLRLGIDGLEPRIALAADFEVRSEFRSFDWAFKSAAPYSAEVVDTAEARNVTMSNSITLTGSSSWTSPTDGTSTVSGFGSGAGRGEFLVAVMPELSLWRPGTIAATETYSGNGTGTFTDGRLSASIQIKGSATVTILAGFSSTVPYDSEMSLSASGTLVSETYPHQVPLTVFDERVVGGEVTLTPSIITTNDNGSLDFDVRGRIQEDRYSFQMKMTGRHPNVAVPAAPVGRVGLGYSTGKMPGDIVQDINFAADDSAIYWNTSTISLSASTSAVRENAPPGAKFVVAYVTDVISGIAERSVNNNVFALPLTQLEYQIVWNPERGGPRVTWVATSQIDEATTVNLYFADGGDYADRLGDPVYSFIVPAGARPGTRAVVQVPQLSLADAPEGVTHLIVASNHLDAKAIEVDIDPPRIRLIKGPKGSTYAAGKTLSFKVEFTENVVATGTPYLPILIGDVVRLAIWDGRGSGKKSLTFKAVVQPGDFAPKGIWVAGPIGLPGGASIRDKAGNALNPNAVVGGFPKAKVDAVGPRVTEFRPVVVGPRSVSLQVAFTEPVTVNGKPTIPFMLEGIEKNLVYSGRSSRNVLSFRYNAARREVPTAENVVLSAPGIVLGRGRITDTVRNVATSLAQPEVVIQWVPVGDSGNANDPLTGSLYGGVDHEYRIGAYEVTIGQYAKFLNAVAVTDTYGLYNQAMGTDLNVAGISRSGSPGSYTYTVMNNGGDSSNRPITYVSWFNAARFANWMHNGQPTGLQRATTTEDGAYTLNGATSGFAPTRNAAAQFAIPTENEWYKAAYYAPLLNAGSGGYYSQATQSQMAPGNTVGSGGNRANYRTGAGYSVTQAGYSASQNYLTDVGAFTMSASFYGTFDQSGNVSEWNDLTGAAGASRGVRGGDWNDSGAVLVSSSTRGERDPESAFRNIGFRIVGRFGIPNKKVSGLFS